MTTSNFTIDVQVHKQRVRYTEPGRSTSIRLESDSRDAWWLWPEIIRREAIFVAIALVCMLLPTAIAYLKYREVPGYHTWSVKLGSLLMGVSIPLLLLFDVAAPFRAAALWQVVCAIDELGITALLPACRHDVPSLFHALRLRRSA